MYSFKKFIALKIEDFPYPLAPIKSVFDLKSIETFSSDLKFLILKDNNQL